MSYVWVKRFNFICTTILFIAAAAAADLAAWNTVVSEDNPLHWYRFNESAGSDCIDYGSGSLNGTYEGVTLAQEGILGTGQAVRFPGSGYNRVTFGIPEDYPGEWTVEYVVKKIGTATQVLHDSTICSLRLVQYNAMGAVGFTRYGISDYTFAALPGQNLVVPPEEWTHVAFRKTADGKSQVLINGILAGTSANSVLFPPMQIGSHLAGSDPLNAFLDEAVMYDRALSDEEIQNHSNAIFPSLVPDSFDYYLNSADLLINWSSPTATLSLETAYTYASSPKSMKAVSSSPLVITKDMGASFEYGAYDGRNLVMYFLGDIGNEPADVTLKVIDDTESVVESFTIPEAAVKTEWSAIGVPVDPASEPRWQNVQKIRIEVGAAATMYFDNLNFQTPYIGLPGDLNGDRKVNAEDLVLFAGQWLEAGCFGLGCADLDVNLGVDGADFAIFSENWLDEQFPLTISEFMAVNSYVPFTNPLDIHTVVNGVDEHYDWIEIHNSSDSETFNLAGWYLTDDENNLTKWRFSSVSIEPGGNLVVWASEKTFEEHPENYPFVDDLGNLHTNFRLSESGEYLAMVEPDGVSVVHEYAPKYPPQRGLISYGIGIAGIEGYLRNPTYKNDNSGTYLGVVADTKFSVDRGFYENHFDVEITCATEGATIRYTRNGSTPTLFNGSDYIPGNPIHIDGTTCLRAAAFKADYLPTDVDTQTYIFLDDVIEQSPNGEAPPGWPTGIVNTQVFEYGMDPDIVNHPEYGPLMLEAMSDIPSISLVTDMRNLVDPVVGIYVNAYQEGILWERPTSAELINPDGSEGFQVNAGLRIRGAYSRTGSNPKHSFRLLFKGGYGPSNLKFPMFENEGVDEFDNIDLRTAQNYAWSNWGNEGWRNTFIRDVYARDLQREQSKPYTRSRYYHLYLNGQYWGLFQSQERSEASYAESYFGSYKEYYDVIKTDNYMTSYTDGSLDEWNELWWLCEAGFETDAKYYGVQGKNPDGSDNPDIEVHVDVENLIDYMLDIFFTGNRDAPVTLNGAAANNFYAIRNRRPQSRQGWQFFAYDSEHSMLYTTDDRTVTVSAGTDQHDFNPQWLHQKLMVHPEYRLKFADRAHKHMFNDGCMTPQKSAALCLSRAYEIDMAIIGESARWGDHRDDRVDNPYTKADWWAEVNGYLVNTFFPVRTDIVLNQLINRGLYPNVPAPVFNQHGGEIPSGFNLTMTAPTGTIYYTIDGSDTRLAGGDISPNAFVFEDGSTQTTIVPQDAVWKYLDDGSDQGTEWRQLGFSDSTWESGPAELGYGDGDENTVVSYGPDSSNKYITTYFRRKFNVPDPSEFISLTLGLVRDDGAVVYLNGKELFRDVMPDGEINYLTLASIYHDDNTFHVYPVNPVLLYEGDNQLAVEIHQSSGTSSDISFNLYLVGAVNSGGGSAIELTSSTQIKARSLDGDVWSALNEATFSVGSVAESVRITELMYHPADPNTEFVELRNIGPNTINLNLVTFTDGVDFTFGAGILDPNEYIVVVENISEFQNRYGTGINIAGQYTGKFDNAGEKIKLVDAIGTTIHDFEYKDSWYDITDGLGFSLTVKDPYAVDPNLWDDKKVWRPSALAGGSPGYDDSDIVPAIGSIVINEVLAHSDSWPDDWIELHNTTAEAVNIGGWFLSDNNNDDPNYMKYRIADGTSIDPNGYIVFTQDENFGNINEAGCIVPFALSENGEAVYLRSGIGDVLTGYYEEEDFGASEVGVAFGRYIKSTLDGGVNFVAMSENTRGYQNAYPKVGPVIINEIMYNPPTDGIYDHDEYEYIELYNIGDSQFYLQEYDNEQHINVPWKFTDGIDYTFPLGTSIAPGQRIVVVKNPAAFSVRYPAVPTSKIFGPYDGQLSNGGEKLQLSKPGDEVDGVRYYIRVDRVNYDDEYPWPLEADGLDLSLHQKTPTLEYHNYSNDVINWQAAAPSLPTE